MLPNADLCAAPDTPRPRYGGAAPRTSFDEVAAHRQVLITRPGAGSQRRSARSSVGEKRAVEHALVADGRSRFKGSRCVVPWRARAVLPLLLRRRASRPQLKRDPLGSRARRSETWQYLSRTEPNSTTLRSLNSPPRSALTPPSSRFCNGAAATGPPVVWKR